jgi:NTE family protein
MFHDARFVGRARGRLCCLLLFLMAASLPALPRPRVAVVLSGGAALGLAHVGVLRVIEQAGIPIDMVVGTSMGAIVGGMYAVGYSPDQLDSIVTKLDWSTVLSEQRDSLGDHYNLLKRQRFPFWVGFDGRGINVGAGLLEGQNALAFFTELTLHDLGVRDFDTLPVPYRAVATDIMSGEKVVIAHGSIAEAMRSSMSLPGIFRPYTLEGRRLVDGGIADNMPVDVAREMGADIVIAVESGSGKPADPEFLNSSVAITSQTLNLLIAQNMESARRKADLVITPDLHDFNMMSFTDVALIVAKGKEGAEAKLTALKEIAARIEKSRPLVQPDQQANRSARRPLPEITTISAEGGSPADRALARSVFAPLAGKPADGAAVHTAVDSLYASGRFDLVTFDLAAVQGTEGAPSRAAGVVRLVPNTTSAGAMVFGGGFRALFTSISSSVSQIMAGVVLRDLTGMDSALFAEAGFLDQRRISMEYFQPFGVFFLMPFFRYEDQFDDYYVTSSAVSHTLYKSAGGGLWAGFMIGKYVDLMAGYSFEGVASNGFLDPSLGMTIGTLSAVLRAGSFSTTVFPESGWSTAVRARWADAALGGNTAFTALEWNYTAAVPLSDTFTLGAACYAGSDFSGIPGMNGSLPAVHALTIRQAGMFYGLEQNPSSGMGNHAAALGLELRMKLGSISPLLGVEFYGLANLSAAAVRQGLPGNPGFIDFLPFRWAASLGLGAHITDHLGVLAALSFVSDGNAVLGPRRLAFTMEVGSFAQFLEDRR